MSWEWDEDEFVLGWNSTVVRVNTRTVGGIRTLRVCILNLNGVEKESGREEMGLRWNRGEEESLLLNY